MPLNLRGLQTFRSGLPDAIDAGAKQAAAYVADLAAELAPEDTGALKASIHADPDAPAGVGRVVAGGDGIDYAGYVEYGTQHSPAQPYLTPALRAINVKTEIKKAIQDLVTRSRA